MNELLDHQAAVDRMWVRCERVARRRFYETAWRGGFLTGAVVTHALWILAVIVRFTLFR